LNDKQVASIKTEKVALKNFSIEVSAVGAVDFNEDASVPVFAHYQGRIANVFAKLGDDVEKDQLLYTINSPDLAAAEGNLIGAAATLKLTDAALKRAQGLYAQHGIAEKDLQQAISDQANGQGTYVAAVAGVKLFGKSDAQIAQIIKSGNIDANLEVKSPVKGRVTARNAQPGSFVQPGTLPAPITVSDISTVWLVANVTEAESVKLKSGQAASATLKAFSGRTFNGVVDQLGTSVDPNVHTVIARAAIPDPNHELRPNMIGSIAIEVAAPQASPAIANDGVVREGDGTMTAWVQKDTNHFVQRVVKLGIQQDGYDQVLEGLQEGEPVIVQGAIFVDNILNAPPSD
jgi:cobalt-zinc-cadmium efflux system membrane fusion protein